jgi:hypothetical protein
MASDEETVRFSSAEARKNLAHSMVQKLADREGPILALENLHIEIKQAEQNAQRIEERMCCKVAGVFKEISEKLGDSDAIVKEYPGQRILLSQGNLIYEFTGNADPSKNKRSAGKSMNAYRCLVRLLENDNDAKESRKQWEGMNNLELTDKVLNLAYGIARGNGLSIEGKYANQKDEETCKSCCWHGKCE